MSEKKPGFFKRYWNKIPHKVKVALVCTTSVILVGVPFSSSLQFVCLTFLARNTELGRSIAEKLKPIFPRLMKFVLKEQDQKHHNPKDDKLSSTKKEGLDRAKTLEKASVSPDKSEINRKILDNKQRYLEEKSNDNKPAPITEASNSAINIAVIKNAKNGR
ncbi:MAG: hypothetical protein AB7U85_07125 [Alphaproteobacteria bacterium]